MTATDIEILDYEKELAFMDSLMSKCQDDEKEKALIKEEMNNISKRISHLRSLNENTKGMELLHD
jgi:hypothetical protein